MKKRCFLLILILLILIGGTASASFFMEMIDVGAGDAFLLRSGNSWMMIDTGPAKALPKVEKALEDLNIQKLDALLITHPHPDHAGNLAAVLEKIPVGRVYISGAEQDSYFFNEQANVLDTAGVSGIFLYRGNRFSVGDMDALVLWPEPEPLEVENDRSVVLRLTCGSFSMIFTGDAELETERCLLAGMDDLPLKADFLKIGHHGMDTSTGYPFLEAVSPEYCFISCGREDQTATLSRSTLTTLQETGVSYIFSTRDWGSMILEIDDSNQLTIRQKDESR